MPAIEIYFDGYCPESQLQGIQVEMRLNKDDFWESIETGLQVAVFPPYATILKWRGKGKFKQSTDIASGSLSGLVMAAARDEKGKEIFPDEANVIGNNNELKWYLDKVLGSEEEFKSSQSNPSDPMLPIQAEHLAQIPNSEFNDLIAAYSRLAVSHENKLVHDEQFSEFHSKLYDLKIIFGFKWMEWKKGWKEIEDIDFSYNEATMLDLSMYLTAIFRGDRFNDGLIDYHFNNGNINKIMERLKTLSKDNMELKEPSMNNLKINCTSTGSIRESFDTVANTLFNDIRLEVNKNYYRLLDIEFYYYAPELHEDVYAHKHEAQLQPCKWYFHGSGIDITIGNGVHHGGILIRSIGKISPTGNPKKNFIEKEIHGPLLVKTEICSNLHGVFDYSPNVFNLGDVSIDRMPALMRMPKHIIKTKRIGLNPDNDETDQQEFYNGKYRYVIFPFLKLKDKTQIAIDMLEQYPELGKAGVNKELGSAFLK